MGVDDTVNRHKNHPFERGKSFMSPITMVEVLDRPRTGAKVLKQTFC